jgi:hypothetical protein
MMSINERDSDILDGLDEKVNLARKNDFPTKLNAAKRSKIFEIEDNLAEGRKTAARYATLKFV